MSNLKYMWSREQQPNEGIRYNHMLLVSPSGNSVASPDGNVTADKLTELKMLLTRAAFLHAPYFNNDVFKDSVIRSFGEEVYLECLKTFDK